MAAAAPFRWFLAGQAVSMAGSAMAPVALAFGVLGLTHSAVWLSVVTTSALIPMVATLLLGGGVADRYPRDTVLRLTSVAAGLTQAGVAALLLTHRHPAFLIPLSVLNGVAQGLIRPTLRGILANLVDSAGLQRASSLLSSAGNVTAILGPAAAGLLTASVGGGWAIAVDAASFLVAAACFGRMALPRLPARTRDSPGMIAELRQGWGYFRSHAWIWSVTMGFAVFNGLNRAIWQILGPVIAAVTIGPQGWGLVLSTRGAGALLGAAIMVRLPLRRPMIPALTAMSVAALPLILLGAGASTVWLALSAFVGGVATELFTVVWTTVNNVHIPERLLSRVGAHDEFWSTAPAPLGQLATPFLAAVFGSAATAIAGGTIAAVAILLPLTVPALREIEIRR
ncbi:MFS transporter [Actinoplanes sp. NPDC051851]|uniref:MFS transporter n=1 Tax=Actinoplanes sp. NPDC051851 TaxID=3154753 RepID=UPI00343BF4C1